MNAEEFKKRSEQILKVLYDFQKEASKALEQGKITREEYDLFCLFAAGTVGVYP